MKLSSDREHNQFDQRSEGLESVIDELVKLETELQDPAVRKNKDRLNRLLHDAFQEIGRSGEIYDKARILSSLEAESTHSIWSQDFELRKISSELIILTYRSAHIGPENLLTRFSRRSSLWAKEGGEWKLRFHQGTPTNAFEKLET